MKSVLQLVPYLPPAISGVGDYALILARGLRDTHGWQTTFAVAHPNEGQSEIEGFPVVPLTNHSARDLAETLALFERVLLHYVGYGFQKRGCPFWLAGGLNQWKARRRDGRLVTMFHELYASGPPWRSTFWTSPAQRWIARELARHATAPITNRSASADWLKRSANSPVPVLPVFSNVGENPEGAAWSQRPSRACVFVGGPGFSEALSSKMDELVEFIRQQGVEEVVSMGKPLQGLDRLPVKVVQRGRLPDDEVHQELLRCRYGLATYFPGYLGKSGVLAAYAAHGVVPVFLNSQQDGSEGLMRGQHYLDLDDDPPECPSEEIAGKVWQWYQPHSVQAAIQRFHQLLS